ncbi:hypothetical protein QQF64_022722 [Cirrhinus molitorella]|uniref:Chemokine interleukin-8-like domain-containing protein n=1 Tax=Cirrhinus molitorella TaxID=172907 RepID=A0ABR3L5M4_9TELE
MKTFMKTSLLFLMLCCALQLSTSAGPFANESAETICCFNTTKVRITLQGLESFFWTGSGCPLKNIVFVSSTRKQFCTDSKEKWVQRAITYLDKKHAQNSTK